MTRVWFAVNYNISVTSGERCLIDHLRALQKGPINYIFGIKCMGSKVNNLFDIFMSYFYFLWGRWNERTYSLSLYCYFSRRPLSDIPTASMRGSRNFFQGGGGGVQARRSENILNNVFFFLFFSKSSTYFSLQRGSNGFITEKTILFQGSRGGPTLSRGDPTFFQEWGVQMLISIETYITCAFPGGGGGVRTPYSPLVPHFKCLYHYKSKCRTTRRRSLLRLVVRHLLL